MRFQNDISCPRKISIDNRVAVTHVQLYGRDENYSLFEAHPALRFGTDAGDRAGIIARHPS
jgi:hypothetical protein